MSDLPLPADTPARFGSGQSVRRIEDPALVSGAGQYVDDLAMPRQTFLAFLRSPHAHARIVSIDTSAALEAPGVLAVFTGADLVAAGVKPMPAIPNFKRADGSAAASPVRHVLAHEVVRFVGEAVVAVVAETRALARDAAELVMVEYEDLPAVADPVLAIKPGAPARCPQAPDNICAQMRHGNAAATDQAFASAAHVLELELVNQRLAPTPIEPRGVLAWIDSETGRLTVRLSSQMPTAVLKGLCALIPGLSTDQVRVLVGDVGGGFGMKTGMYPEDVVLAWAALQLKRPVRWQAERVEEFLSALHGRDVKTRAALALDANGKVLALRVASLANVGAYPTGPGVGIQLMIGPWVSTSIYDIQTIDLQYQAVLTNTAPTGPYRGAGRPEAIYIIERLMDAAARQLAMDPAELRRRNMIRPEQMPYRNPMNQTYDSGQFEKIMEQALALADWNLYEVRKAASARRGKLRGRSVTTFLEWTGGNAFEERVTVTVTPDGMIEIFSATQAMGQGIATSYAQLAVDVFDVPIERIRILQGDTDRAQGFGSAGSRSLFTGGSAVHVAAEKTLDEGLLLAAQALETSVADVHYRSGRFVVVGTDLAIGLAELAGRQPDGRIFIDATSAVAGPSWPNACHVCEVELDPDTGHVDIVAYASVNDIGRVVSPVIARGQIEGGAVQGIGQALCEQVRYDPETGQLQSASLLDYALPRVDGYRAFITAFDTSIPCQNNPLGVKGVGELGTIGATPAVVNATIDALASAGVAQAAQLQMPLTAERVWQALQGEFGAPVFG
jgi:carbon-monoxide dehydrogenase large subunit